MKKITRLLSLILALALAVVSVSVTAIADEDVTHSTSATSSIAISGVPTNSTNYFKVYQIFKGVTSDDGDGVLSNIEWGSSLNETGQQALISALNTYFDNTDLTTSSTAAEVAAAIGNITSETDLRTIMMGIFSNSSNIVDDQRTAGISNISWSVSADVSGGTYTHSTNDIEDGYYFIVGVESGVTQDTIVVAVAGDTSASNKTVDAVTISKATSDGTSAYGVGDEVTFVVTVTLPSTLSAYSSYTITVTDTMSGLDFDTSKVITAEIIEPGQSTGASLNDITGSVASNVLTFSTTLDGSSLKFASYAGGTVKFTYKATVTDEGYTSSSNTAKAAYTSDPTDLSVTTETGETDPVQLYTVSIKVNKTDGTDPLYKAFFTLEDEDGEVISTRTSNSDADDSNIITEAGDTISTFYFVGLGAGTYTLSETTTPSGYNTTDDYTIVVNSDGSATVSDSDGNSKDYSISDLTSASGVVELEVVNITGSTLPETGGMGTKIFYTLGGALVVCAGVLLIVKRRMRNA